MGINVPWLPFGIRAITLFPAIVYRKGHRTPAIELHELYHWRQIRRWGVLPWYIIYLVLALVYMGRPANEHPLEREAYRIQWGAEGRIT